MECLVSNVWNHLYKLSDKSVIENAQTFRCIIHSRKTELPPSSVITPIQLETSDRFSFIPTQTIYEWIIQIVKNNRISQQSGWTAVQHNIIPFSVCFSFNWPLKIQVANVSHKPTRQEIHKFQPVSLGKKSSH